MAKRKSKPTQKEKPPQTVIAKERINPRFIATEAHAIPVEPKCEKCGSAEHVIETFIGPWDEPGHHNYGDVISDQERYHRFWCTACDSGVGPVLEFGHKRKEAL